MTKTKDPRPSNTRYCPHCGRIILAGGHVCSFGGNVWVTPKPLNEMLDLVTDKNKHNLDEPPKRCDECRWWRGSVNFGDCVNDEVEAMSYSAIVTNADFYCKYWEKKEE